MNVVVVPPQPSPHENSARDWLRMSVAAFQVKLDIFNGPMDLLLYLVRKHEIDSLEVQLGKVTREFLDFLSVLQMIDVDLVGDFLVVASTLTEIKSRLALPQEDSSEEEAALDLLPDEPDGQLIHQLLEFRRFKAAGKALEAQATQWRERFSRQSDDRPRRTKDPRHDHIKEVELWDLVSAFSRVMRKKVTESHGEIRYEETPISVHSERIRERIQESGRVRFSEFFEGEHIRGRIVGVFLAILELIRHYRYRAEQADAFGEIWVLPPNQQDGDFDSTAHLEPAAPSDDSECASSPEAAKAQPELDQQLENPASSEPLKGANPAADSEDAVSDHQPGEPEMDTENLDSDSFSFPGSSEEE